MKLPIEFRQKVEQAFMDDIGYEHNNRFEDSHSPYYGKEQWHSSTEYSTNCTLKCYDTKWYIEFSFRNVSDDYAINWSKKFLDYHNKKYTNVEPIYNSEKGWFSIHAIINKKDILKKYNLLEEYKKIVNNIALQNYDNLISLLTYEVKPYKSTIIESKDISNIKDGFGSYLSYGDENTHISIRIGGKGDTELNMFSILYYTKDGTEVYRSSYCWSLNLNDHKQFLYKELLNCNYALIDKLRITSQKLCKILYV